MLKFRVGSAFGLELKLGMILIRKFEGKGKEEGARLGCVYVAMSSRGFD